MSKKAALTIALSFMPMMGFAQNKSVCEATVMSVAKGLGKAALGESPKKAFIGSEVKKVKALFKDAAGTRTEEDALQFSVFVEFQGYITAYEITAAENRRTTFSSCDVLQIRTDNLYAVKK